MAKKRDTFMPIYIGDYLCETMALSTEEHGAYLLLRMAYWTRRSLPDNDGALAEIARVPLKRWLEIRDHISRFFEIADGRWRHAELNALLKRMDDAKARVAAAYAAWFNPEWLALRLEVFERDGYVCQYCGATDKELHCDHIMPRSRGGGNELSNLTTACGDCNREKGARTPEEWRGGRA